MKKIMFISIVLFVLVTLSCSDEPVRLPVQSASIWRSTNVSETTLSSDFEYYEVRFISNSTFEIWVKSKTNVNSEKVNQLYGYTIKDNSISIVYNDVTSKGFIEKSTMSITEDGVSLKFVKI